MSRGNVDVLFELELLANDETFSVLEAVRFTYPLKVGLAFTD